MIFSPPFLTRMCIRLSLLAGLSTSGLAQPFPSCADSLFASDLWFQQGNSHALNSGYDRAIQAYQKALQLNPDSLRVAGIYQNLGALFYLQANYEKATIHLEYAYSLLNRHPETDSNRLAGLCLSMGSTWLERNNPGLALHWFRQAGEHLPHPSGTWSIRLSLGKGNVLFSRGDFRGSLAEYRKPFTGVDIPTPATDEEIWVRRNLAMTYLELHQPDSARCILANAMERLNTRETPGQLLPELLLLKARIHRVSGRPEAALESLDQGVDLALNEGMRYRYLYEKVLAKSLIDSGSKENTGNVQCEIREVLDAIGSGERLVEEENGSELPFTDQYSLHTLYLLAMKRLTIPGEYLRQNRQLFVDLAKRAGQFRNRDDTRVYRPSGTLNDSLILNYERLRKVLFRWHKTQLLSEVTGVCVNERQAGNRARSSRHLDSLLIRAKRESPVVSIDIGHRSLLDDIHSNLGQEELLVQFIPADSSLFVLLFSSDTCVVFRQSMDSPDYQTLRQFSKALKSADNLILSSLGYRLYRLFFNPVQELFAGKTRLMIIPGEAFARFPFEALPMDGMEGKTGSSRTIFLIHRFEITYHVSIYSWLQHRLAGPPEHSTARPGYDYDLVVCAPDFNGQPPGTILVFTEEEVKQILNLFWEQGYCTRRIQAEHMNEESFLEFARRSRILHLASHGIMDRRFPELSGWILSTDPTPAPSLQAPDGMLEIGEAQSCYLASELLVFSSCSVGPAVRAPRYRILPFPANFLNAGIQQVLFALWDVSDKHTHQLMQHFYRGYLTGKSFAAALREAKLKLLASPVTACPTMWAVFVLWAR